MDARGRNFYHDLIARYGYPAEADKLQEWYLSGRKNEAAAAVPAGRRLAAPAGPGEGVEYW